MNLQPRKLAWLGRIVGLFGLISIFGVQAAIAPKPIAVPEKAAAMMLKLPLSFEENVGQTNGNAKFIARAPGFTLFATPTEMVTVMNPIAPAKERAIVRTQLAGADRSARLRGEDEQSAKSNYLVGNDPKKWVSGAAHYARVRQTGIYPGVDLVYHGDNAGLEYDFVVAPGADPTRIRLSFSGTEKIAIDTHGDLKLITKQGELTQRKPIVYQDFDGERRSVASEYVHLGKHEVGFKIGAYDRSIELVIDPVVEYATYFGGSINDLGRAIAVDNNGNAYISGTTNSSDFPVTSPNIKGSNATNSDLIFVSKINTNTNTLVYSTYLGGNFGSNTVNAIAVDSSGIAYLAGASFAQDFPVVNGTQTTPGFGDDAIVAKLNATGSALIFSSFLGGNGSDVAYGIKADDSGKIYVVGETQSSNFPLKTPLKNALGGFSDAFVTKIDTVAKTLVYSTYLGGTAGETASGVTVDSSGHTYVVGQTTSSDFPSTPGAFQPTLIGSADAFAVKLSANGQSLDYSTHIGMSGGSIFASAAALDSSGNLVIAGNSGFLCFPGSIVFGTTSFQNNGFIAVLGASGSTLASSACIGGGPLDDLAIDANGNLFVAGFANATIPISGSVNVPTFNRFLLKLPSSATAINYAVSFNPGTLIFPFGGHRIAVDSIGRAYLTGQAGTNSDLPVTTANLASNVKGFFNAILLKIASTLATTISLVGPTTSINGGQSAQFTASVTGATTGNVTFKNGTAILGTQALSGPTAIFNTTSLPVGSSSVTAVYEGDSTHDGSVSAPLAVTVAKAKPTANLNMSSTDPDPGDSVTATVTVKGGSNPTGNVTFRVDGEIKFTSFLTSTGPDSGTASADFKPEGNGLASGNFEATYEGDDNNEAATTNSVRVTTNSGIFGGIGGGGCTFGDDGRDVTLPMLLLLALWGLWRIRRRAV